MLLVAVDLLAQLLVEPCRAEIELLQGGPLVQEDAVVEPAYQVINAHNYYLRIALGQHGQHL